MSGFESADLEFGGAAIRKRYKSILKFYKSNARHIPRVLMLLTVITLSIVVRWGVTNVDRVVEGATGVSFEEDTFVPFTIGEFTATEPVKRKQFEIKTSIVNHKMQRMNLETVTDQVRAFLEESGNVCVHLVHFHVPYDIIVFSNITIVNPQIVEESKVRTNVKEIDLNGDSKWASRAEYVHVRHYNEHLNQVHTMLWGHQSVCFQYYTH